MKKVVAFAVLASLQIVSGSTAFADTAPSSYGKEMRDPSRTRICEGGYSCMQDWTKKWYVCDRNKTDFPYLADLPFDVVRCKIVGQASSYAPSKTGKPQ